MADKKLEECQDSDVYNVADLFCDSEIDFGTIEKSVREIEFSTRVADVRERPVAKVAEKPASYADEVNKE